MRHLMVLTALALMSALVGTGAPLAMPDAEAEAIVHIHIFRVGEPQVPPVAWFYDDPVVNVNDGDTVVWHNHDRVVAHTATNGLSPATASLEDDNPPVILQAFASPSIPYEGTFSKTFDTPGAYPYYCSVGGDTGHHLFGMRGVIVVSEA